MLAAAWLAVTAVFAQPAMADSHGFEVTPLVIESGDARHRFTVEVADDSSKRGRGLMFRPSLGGDEGMIFDFEEVRDVAMWMKNTPVSLDMIFIDDTGRITHIAERTRPYSEAIIPSNGPVRSVLEVVAGTAKRLGIRRGDLVRHRIFSNLQAP